MTDATPATIRRYEQLVTAALPEAVSFTPERETDDAVQVERAGVLWASALRGSPDVEAAGRLVALADAGTAGSAAVVDRAGHARPVYRPLLVYGWLGAMRSAAGALPDAVAARWRIALLAWCASLGRDLAGFDPSRPNSFAASRGAEAGAAAWAALALHVASSGFGRDDWRGHAARFFSSLLAARQPSGAFLKPTPSDNPETLWYHELVLLHAVSSYAAASGDRAATEAAERNAVYHLNETQPDHATAQPWGLGAFVRSDEARPLADQILHAVRVQHGTRADGVTAILLADTACGLRGLAAAGSADELHPASSASRSRP